MRFIAYFKIRETGKHPLNLCICGKYCSTYNGVVKLFHLF